MRNGGDAVLPGCIPYLRMQPVDSQADTCCGQHPFEERAAEVEAQIRETQEKEEAEEKAGTGVDLFKLQPKKPNWDLKRDLEAKLEVLNVRTDNTIAQIVKERINGKKQEGIKELKGGKDH